MQGVNLGGWLVVERWITPSLFEGSSAKDEYNLSGEGSARQKRITNHHKTFIQEDDFKWLRNHNINAVRIPIGYWIFGDDSPYTKSIDRLDWAFKMAKKYDISILLSIHGAPGSQNGKIHSGKEGDIQWRHQQQKLADFTQKIVTHYKDHECFWGIELLNEPSPHLLNTVHLIKYYLQTIKRIKKTSPSLTIVISDGFRPLFWALFCRITGCILDIHAYHGFGKKTHTKTLKSLNQYKKKLSFITKINPTIVGEWSAVSVPKTPPEQLKDYFLKQKTIYNSATLGSFFWTYKSEGGGSWDYKNMTGRSSN